MTGSRARAILGDENAATPHDTPCELPPRADYSRENGDAPGGERANAHHYSPRRSAPSLTTNGADTMIVSARTDVHTLCHEQHAEDTATIRGLRDDLDRVRGLLADAIRAREGLINANLKLYRNSRHWFVDDPEASGYCAACSLPPKHWRHVERARSAA